jgi:hypothetical protein
MRASQELQKEEVLAKMETNHERKEVRRDSNNEKFEGLRVLSSPRFISTTPGQRPLKKK